MNVVNVKVFLSAVNYFHKNLHFRCRSSLPEVFLEKGVLKICSKSREHLSQSVISIKLQRNVQLDLIDILCQGVFKYFPKLKRNTCFGVSFSVSSVFPATLLKKTPPHSHVYEFFEILKNIFLTEHLWENASAPSATQ